MRGEAFVPGHITGFFEVLENEDPLKAGSRGAGVVIGKGVTTKVKVTGKDSNSILVNGDLCECPVTGTVLQEISRISGETGFEVRHELEIPMKYGFGTSGAGALGTALALSEALDLKLTPDQCGEVAHGAEVINKTGMGDVIAQLKGGIVIRTSSGAPGTGIAERISSQKKVVAFLVGDEMETGSVLEDREKMKRINHTGRRCIEEMVKKPGPQNFLELSHRFALKTGLMEREVHLAVKTLKENGITASMAMLGNSVFTLTDEPEEVCKLLDYLYIIADIDYRGAKVIQGAKEC